MKEQGLMTPEEVCAYEGREKLSLSSFAKRFEELGYKLDRSLDCRSVARYLTGPNAGRGYKCVTTGLRESDTGRSAFHFQSRRDSNFRKMMDLRGSIAAISRGAILEV